MYSIISLIRDLFRRRDIVEVRRMPPAKALRAHLLGLTLGLVLVYANLLFDFANPSVGINIALLLWFSVGTYIGGLFVALTLALWAFLASTGPTVPFWVAMMQQSLWYLLGYVFGAAFAILYSDLVFLFITTFERDAIKTAFAVDTRKAVNIIKSPEETEELALGQALKAIWYLAQNIRDNTPDKPQSITQLVRYLRRAHRRMSAEDRTRLLEFMDRMIPPGTPSESFREKLARLEAHLRAQTDNNAILAIIENDVEPLVDKYLKLRDRKLYDFRIEKPPRQPYTIAFVANPKVLLRGGQADNESDYERDPILRDLDLFLRAVDQALMSFEGDTVVGRPEILSRIRVVTIFDESLATASGKEFGLLEAMQEELYTAGDLVNSIDHNIIDPRPDLQASVQNMLDNFPDSPVQIEDLDVIYGITALPAQDRALAHFSDWIETEGPGSGTREAGPPAAPEEQGGIEFSFDVNPHSHQPTGDKHRSLGPSVPGPLILDPFNLPPEVSDELPSFERCHDYYATHPGRVALNALSARRYTYIHEFAHAMASALRGAIFDEYFDFLLAKENGEADENDEMPPPWFAVNRIYRNIKNPKVLEYGLVIPVHKVFCEYNCTNYSSELDHPSAEENWVSYFPERQAPRIFCTMDRANGFFRFDQLLATFMYDRLIAKINRPPGGVGVSAAVRAAEAEEVPAGP